jgi:signal transduction histidine kinase
MKASRGLWIWSALALCAVMVLGAMTWLTRSVLASERERMMAESRADLEERTRLALWRMDAVGAAILLGENQRPPSDYTNSAQDSPFLTVNDPLVRLHFELQQSGRLRSPEIKVSSGLPPALLAERVEKLRILQNLLSVNPLPGDQLMILSCAVQVGENAWQALSKDAVVAKTDNQELRMKQAASVNRADTTYQTNFNQVEKAQRAKAVEQSFENGGNTILQPKVDQSAQQQEVGDREIKEIGPLRAVWIGGELFLLRQLTMMTPTAFQLNHSTLGKDIQGVWLDKNLVEERLLKEVTDLLPTAKLVTLTGDSDPLALVSFPLLLQRNESPVIEATAVSLPLLVGWAAVIVALATASVLVRGVMRLSERRASFVSAVTHELRTPLTTFRLYSDMLQSGAVKEEKRGMYLSVLSREADRLSHLVENVLAFSQIERGSARSAVRMTTAVELLEPMRERFESRLLTAGMTLEMDLTREAASVPMKVDAAAVEHILFNLVDNAAKYASGGQPPILSFHIFHNDSWIEIHAIDRGPGIAAGERSRIFQAFHKSAHEAAESKPGVGLGLALSRRLAKSLGGSLMCRPSDEGGTRFVLTLPSTPTGSLG